MAGFINALAGNVAQVAGIQRQWSTGLCDCMKDTSSCCDIWFCTPCAVARQCNAIDGQSNTNDMCLCCASLIMLYYGNGGVATLAMIIRYRLIAKYNIAGEGVIGTFFNASCCPYCSLCQSWRELSNMALWPGGTCCAVVQPLPFNMN